MEMEDGRSDAEKIDDKGGEDGEWTEVNYALPFWKETSNLLNNLQKNLMAPQDKFCGLLRNPKNELVAWGCCWVWIPLNVLYMVFMAVLLCVIATIASVFGFVQSLLFLAVGIWPGFIIAFGITGISIIRIPWNIYNHCFITYKNIQHGNFIKAGSFFLLIPGHIFFPIIVGIMSISAIAVSMVIAFFGCPQTPWNKIGFILKEAWQFMGVNMQQKVKSIDFTENTENYSSPTWMFLEELFTSLPKVVLIPLPLFHRISKVQDCCWGFLVITVFCPMWIPLVIVYFLFYVVIAVIITVPFIILGITQSLIHMLFGIWPGFIFPVYITFLSIAGIPWSVFNHCIIIIKTIKMNKFIQAINFLLLLPTQLLVPVILFIGSLGASILSAAVISLLGCPQVPWKELPNVCKKAHSVLFIDVSNLAKNYGSTSQQNTNSNQITNSEGTEENYAAPYWKGVGKALTVLSDGVVSPNTYISGASKSTIRAVLCCPLWLPVGIVFFIITGLTFAAVLIPMAIIGLIQSIIYLILGIWPGLLIGICVTAITIIRIPWNICYHILVTYRTVLLRRSLKVSSIILVPPTHLVVPVVIGVISFGCCIPASAAVSFSGKPHLPWTKLPHLVKKFWKKYVTDVKAHVENYGHESGIPQNWNGRIYGLPLDPITIVMSILFYFYAVVPVTLGVIFIVLIKAIPILIRGIVGYVKCMDFCKATKSWAGKIEEYAQFNACEKFANIISNYFKLIKHLSPSAIFENSSGYSKECDVCKCIPAGGCEQFILSPCIVMVSIFWIFGLSVVVLFSIFQIVLGFLAWILGWILTIVGPPILYLLSWFGLLILVPLVYIVVWILGMCCTVLLPWPFLAITALLGPLLAFKVPYVVFKHNLLNPAGMDQSFKMGLRKPLEIIKELDKFTGAFSFKKWTLWQHPETDETDNIFTTKEIRYWDLFHERSVKEVSEIIDKNWLTSDDIVEASSTAMIAIPGATILSVLVDFVNKENSDKSLIYWNEKNQCTSRTRNARDNISNHFFPLLLKLKVGLRQSLDLETCKAFITSSLCDGDDEKTKELEEFLQSQVTQEDEKKKYLKVRSELENLVHSLLRVEKVQKMLNLICQYDYQTRPKIRKDSSSDAEDQV